MPTPSITTIIIPPPHNTTLSQTIPYQPRAKLSILIPQLRPPTQKTTTLGANTSRKSNRQSRSTTTDTLSQILTTHTTHHRFSTTLKPMPMNRNHPVPSNQIHRPRPTQEVTRMIVRTIITIPRRRHTLRRRMLLRHRTHVLTRLLPRHKNNRTARLIINQSSAGGRRMQTQQTTSQQRPISIRMEIPPVATNHRNQNRDISVLSLPKHHKRHSHLAGPLNSHSLRRIH